MAAEHLGWEAISKALGVSIPTARKWWERDGLLVYKRNRPHGRQRWCWATTDALILTWQTAKAMVDRREALAERAQRKVAATSPEGTPRER